MEHQLLHHLLSRITIFIFKGMRSAVGSLGGVLSDGPPLRLAQVGRASRVEGPQKELNVLGPVHLQTLNIKW